MNSKLKCKVEVYPYNDNWYKNCFYVPLIAGIKYFKKNEKIFFLNDLFYLDIDDEITGFPLTLKNRIISSDDQILNQLGIGTKRSRTLLTPSEIFSQLSSDRLILVPIDRYYWNFEFNDDFYMKRHYPHFVLIYGIDSDTALYDVIHVNETNCVCNKISFELIEKANKGFAEFMGESEYSDIIIISNEADIQYDDNFCKQKYIDNIKQNRSFLIRNNDKLDEIYTVLVDHINEYLLNEDFNITLSFFMLEKALNTEKFILGTFFHNSEIESSIDSMLNNLFVLRFLLIKAKRRNSFNENNKEVISGKIHDMIEERKNLNNLLMSINE